MGLAQGVPTKRIRHTGSIFSVKALGTPLPPQIRKFGLNTDTIYLSKLDFTKEIQVAWVPLAIYGISYYGSGYLYDCYH
jgi:hypothetical protein